MKGVRSLLALQAVALLFVALYLLQILSPLRLNTDAWRFLSMAISSIDGRGYLVDGHPDPSPPGYPFLLAGLIRAGLGSTVGLNTLNIASFLGGCGLFYWLLGHHLAIPPSTRIILGVIPLACWVCVKHVAVPLSENPYVLFSMATLAALSQAWRARGWKLVGWLMAAFALAVIAFRMRTIGASLVGTVFVVAVLHPQPWGWTIRRLPQGRAARIALAAILACLVVGAAGLVWHHQSVRASSASSSNYLQQQMAGARHGWLGFFKSATVANAQTVGEIFLNLPASRFPKLVPVFTVVGAALLVVMAVGWWALARRGPPLAIYMLLFCGILLFWPYYDARLWMPLVPLSALCLWLAVEPYWPHAVVRWTGATAVGVYLLLGLAALGFSTRLSLSGKRFPLLYGDGTNRDSYRVAFGLASRSELPAVDDGLVQMLQRFEPLARGGAEAP